VEIERGVTGRRPLTFLGCFWFDSGILAAGRAPVYRSGLGAFCDKAGEYRPQNASVIKHNQSALGDEPAT